MRDGLQDDPDRCRDQEQHGNRPQCTFFNYVGSNEKALLGSMPPLPDERQRAAYIAGMGGTPFEDLVRARLDTQGGGHDATEMTVSLAHTVFQQLRGAWAHAAASASA